MKKKRVFHRILIVAGISMMSWLLYYLVWFLFDPACSSVPLAYCSLCPRFFIIFQHLQELIGRAARKEAIQ